MPYSFKRATQTCQRMIRSYGERGVLRRTIMGSPSDRAITCAETTFSPMEHAGRLYSDLDRLILLSTEGLTLDPNHELDTLILYVPATHPHIERPPLRLTQPPNRIGTAGQVIYWELLVRGS